MALTMIDSGLLQEHLRTGGWQLVDVRTPAEFETAHIPGSHHLPLEQLGEHAGALDGIECELVLVCQSGPRAEQAARTLAAAGVARTRVLEGGLNAWTAAGGPVERGRQRWALERQVRLVAGSLVLAGVLGSVAQPKLKWLAGGVGAGLTFAAVSNTCMMANVLGRLPHNQAGGAPDCSVVVADIVRQARAGTAS